MKKILIPTLLVNILLAYTLKVEVYNIKNNNGVVQINIYNKDGTIPDKTFTNYYKMKRTPIKDKKAVVVFNLPEGKYAVGIFHDENNNHKVEKGWILPTEGVGFSKFDSINLMNKPSFKKASFLLDKNKTIKIKTIYF